jgi:hypothetical protein
MRPTGRAGPCERDHRPGHLERGGEVGLPDDDPRRSSSPALKRAS